MRTYLIFCPCFPFPCPPILSELGLYSIPPDNSLLPSFRLSHVSLSTLPPCRLLHSHHLSASYLPQSSSFQDDLMSSMFSGEPETEKGGQIDLQQQISSSGLCVCLGDRSAGTHIIPEPWGQADGRPSQQAPGLADKTRLAVKDRGSECVLQCLCVKVWKNGQSWEIGISCIFTWSTCNC